MFDWTPKPGTLPGRTEMRCLRAMLSLERAGADPAPLGAVYGFILEMKHPAVDLHDVKWQVSKFMEKSGYKLDYTDSSVAYEDRKFVHFGGLVEISQETALEIMLENDGPIWEPAESTVHKRLKDMSVRGQVEKVGPALWRMTPEGRELAKRAEVWV